MQIQVKVNGLRKVLADFEDRKARLEDMTPFWKSVGMVMQRQTMRHFEEERAPDGTPWKPLSRRRVQQRLKRHKTGQFKILSDTGTLRRSVSYRADKNYVVLGSNLVYAAIHQLGGTITVRRKGTYKRNYGPGKPQGRAYSYVYNIRIPARPYLGVTASDEQRIRSMMKMYLEGGRH